MYLARRFIILPLLLSYLLALPGGTSAAKLNILEVRTYLENRRIYDVTVDGRGITWVAVSGKGVYRFERGDTDTTAVLFTKDDGLVGVGSMWDLAADSENRLWIAVWGKGLSVLDDGGTAAGEDDVWKTFTGDNYLRHDELPAIDIDSRGDKWLGYSSHDQFGGGVGYLHTGEGDTTGVDFDPSPGGLQYDAVTTLKAAGDTALWIGLYRHQGLDYLDHRGTPADTGDDEWLHCTGSTGLASDDVNALFVDTGGHCWVGTTGGISRFSGAPDTAPVNLGIAEGLSNLHVTDIAEDWEGNIWIATQSGLNLIFRENRDEIFRTLGATHGLANDTTFALAADTDGRCLWVGTENGLNQIRYEVTGETDMITLYPNPFIPGTGGHDRVKFLNLSLPVKISIFTPSGDRILSFTTGHESGAFWDGRNSSGKNVAPGIYFIVLTLQNNETVVKKCAVIR